MASVTIPVVQYDLRPRAASDTIPRRRYDHDAVLDLWASGLSAETIARRLGMARPQSATVIVRRARESGDRRAYRPPLKAGRSSASTERVLDMWDAGAKTSTIAAEAGISEGAVRCVICYARQKGDPRAVRRNRGPATAISAAAFKRGITVAELKARLLAAIVEGGLIDAILDDDRDAAAASAAP